MPLETVAILVCGLKDDSRIMIKHSGQKISIDRLINATICDHLGFLAWSKTKDAKDGINRPPRFVDILTQKDKSESDYLVFENGEDFHKAWNEINRGK